MFNLIVCTATKLLIILLISIQCAFTQACYGWSCVEMIIKLTPSSK